jgi:hypothetical protein
MCRSTLYSDNKSKSPTKQKYIQMIYKHENYNRTQSLKLQILNNAICKRMLNEIWQFMWIPIKMYGTSD